MNRNCQAILKQNRPKNRSDTDIAYDRSYNEQLKSQRAAWRKNNAIHDDSQKVSGASNMNATFIPTLRETLNLRSKAPSRASKMQCTKQGPLEPKPWPHSPRLPQLSAPKITTEAAKPGNETCVKMVTLSQTLVPRNGPSHSSTMCGTNVATRCSRNLKGWTFYHQASHSSIASPQTMGRRYGGVAIMLWIG